MSKYIDSFGHGYQRLFVVVNDCDGLLVDGIFKTYEKALGSVMMSIDDFSDSYKHEGDTFKVGQIEHDENGDWITIHFQKYCWDKPCEETYFILNYDKRKKKWDKPRKDGGG